MSVTQEAPPEAALRPTIEAAAATARHSAEEGLASVREFQLLRDAGSGARTYFLARDTAVKDAQGRLNVDLTARGVAEARERADAALEAGLNGIRERIIGEQGDALVSQFPVKRIPLSPDLAPEATFRMTAAGSVLPAMLLNDVAAMLGEAIDPATPNPQKFRLHQLLTHVYAPVLERYASAPPKHWQEHAQRASELSSLVALHLDTITDGPRVRLARESVARFRSDFKSMVTMARNDGWDDLVISIGNRAFAWPDAKAS